VPLRFAGFLGLVITIASGLLGVFILVQSIIMHDPLGLKITGTAMLAVMLLFLVGIVLSCLGIMSYYLAAMYTETLARPLYVIRKSKD
jgi:dolichol-phosphate mannosyltransferase